MDKDWFNSKLTNAQLVAAYRSQYQRIHGELPTLTGKEGRCTLANLLESLGSV